MARRLLLFALFGAGFSGSPGAASADTCFHVCLKAKMTATDITDQGIRDLMTGCRDECEDEARARLAAKGLADKIAACTPQPVDDADLKKVRSGSPSVVAFANAFTWDVNNVLPGKIIRRVEIGTQTMSLQGVTITASGIVEPGESATFLMNNVSDGYPSLRVTSRIKAIYVCPSE
ncbi:hypothetical protein [uncultured Rhodoblastus sp.]|uniref:hypothetical protein n=1 Tax=uncultured Rhodoblastus sp. TaxID=543037 RepID=UPI0025E23BB5|nr:hypothetical protein [uncultured Rhodoblastus sp.]